MTWAWPQVVEAEKPSKPKTMGQLLEQVRTGWKVESTEIKKREAEFVAAKKNQRKLLKKAKAQLKAEQKRSKELEDEFDKNEALMARLEETLRIRLGTMGELFGVIRQVAGDTRGHLDVSLVSAQIPDRGKQLETLASSKGLPSIKQLENLWFLLQQEMIESGKVVRFPATMVSVHGEKQKVDVIRVGTFNALTEGKYLNWMPEVGQLVELGRQPPARFLSTVTDLQEAKEGYVRFGLDPSRGSILSLLVQTPDFLERIHFGGLIGYVIIGLGLVTMLLALLRLLVLVVVGVRVRRQLSCQDVRTSNPLGRILDVQKQYPDADTEVLEHKLDEAILRESARLERYLWAVKIVSVVAPLMGLLGTVTGMIQTFQSITLFGTGDPKLMAGGISEALVTTMLGLLVAIPLVLLHSWMKSMSTRMVEVLEEQSTGMVAKHREEACRVDTAD
jgi:biopolymer transport protein ExbB